LHAGLDPPLTSSTAVSDTHTMFERILFTLGWAL
jgi:hypothetical protein